MRYAVVIERGEAGFGAYVPDLPGCAAAGETLAEVRALIKDAIPLHLQLMREQGEPVPPPVSQVEYVEVEEPALAPAG
jgi:predicted RNase H-like HicB family nuclease